MRLHRWCRRKDRSVDARGLIDEGEISRIGGWAATIAERVGACRECEDGLP